MDMLTCMDMFNQVQTVDIPLGAMTAGIFTDMVYNKHTNGENVDFTG